MGKPFVIVLQGPTAVGKSDLALNLAKTIGSYIISADSRQIYKELKIGTARPSPKDLKAVKHFFIDELDPKEVFSAGEFARRAQKIISQRSPQIPIIVGGTGFYCKALLEGLSSTPQISPVAHEKLHKIKNIYAKLQEVDPELAQNLHPHDTSRIRRGLLVYFSCQKPLSSFWKQKKEPSPYEQFSILLSRDRKDLYERIDQRLDKMLKQGLLKEIQSLLSKGYKWSDPGLNTVGYKEFQPYFQKEKTLAECLAKAKQDSRNFAKRQLTWYRKIKFDLTLSARDNNLPTVLSILKSKKPLLF